MVLPAPIQDPQQSTNSTQSIVGWRGLLLCPKEYSDVLEQRVQNFQKVQQKIKGAGLNSEQEKQLHVAIQGYFREWFVQTNQYKSVTDLVK
mmetsp:Transcript_2000/g.3545  ORF Transcript_2000/g.3545 Transcript_2000/m.3545 type:complete len:91 (-) Transcript_2000:27-299(-)